MSRPDYFNLSRFAGTCAREAAKHLGAGGSVFEEAVAAGREGFVIVDPTALARAATVFAEVAVQPGSRQALSQDTLQQRADLILAVSRHLKGLNDALDLRWSSAWADFMTPKARAAVSHFHAFARAYRAGAAETLRLLEADCVRHREEEMASR